MIGWNDFFYYFFIGVMELLSVLGLWFTVIMPGIERVSKRFFRSFFVVLMLCGLTGLAGSFLRLYPIPTAIRFLQVPECLLLALPLPMLTFFLFFCCGEDLRRSRLLRTVLGLWTIYFVLVTSGLFTDAFFFVTSDRQVYRGPWYPLMLLPAIVIDLLNLTAVIRRRKMLSRKVYLCFLIALIPITVTVLVQLFMDVFLLIGICTVLFALSMFGFILSDQIERDLRCQREIAQQRASIMVLQMRPHFIYNTMTSIYCLCSRDTEKAQQVIMDFTTYLRKNFTSVASASPIPFTSELEHTRAYLDVELALFSKSLSVDYDTPHTFFRLPPLTLQPIVENAVKHGRNPDASPLHISIRTRKTESGSEITVLDNGRGFDPDDNSDPGIAIKNIRQRLEMMCGGSLTITPNEGGGTVVTVTIPNSAAP